MTYKLYWIYDDRSHTDMTTEGYVGVTTQELQARLKFHKNCNTHSGATTSYGRTLFPILAEIPDEHIKIKLICSTDCQETSETLERLLRPTAKIGWNKQKGGKSLGISKPFKIVSPNGYEKIYPTKTAARADGWNDGQITQVLSPKYSAKTISNKTIGMINCTVEYID